MFKFQKKQTSKKIKKTFVILLIFVIILLVAIYLLNSVSPTIVAFSEAKIKSLTTFFS